MTTTPPTPATVEPADYWATRDLWTHPKSTAAPGKCNGCGQEAVVCYLFGHPVRAYHPWDVDLKATPCPDLLHISGDPDMPLSADILPSRVTVTGVES